MLTFSTQCGQQGSPGHHYVTLHVVPYKVMSILYLKHGQLVTHSKVWFQVLVGNAIFGLYFVREIKAIVIPMSPKYLGWKRKCSLENSSWSSDCYKILHMTITPPPHLPPNPSPHSPPHWNIPQHVQNFVPTGKDTALGKFENSHSVSLCACKMAKI